MRESEELLAATVSMDEEAVAEGLARAHDAWAASLFYSDEQSLRSVVKFAYLAAVDHYASVEEMPGGRGFADVCYLPRRGSGLPALVVELKWNKPADAAIAQIRERGYADVAAGLGVPVLLVGVTYDPKTKVHVCRIEEL